MRKLISFLVCVMLCLVLCACSLSDIADSFTDSETQRIEKSDVVKKYYYKGGALSEFKPDDNYGTVVPYLCRRHISASEKGDFSAELTYGFACADGKIITGGAYGNIYTEVSSDSRVLYVCELVPRDDGYRYFHIIPSSGDEMIEFSVPENSRNRAMKFDAIPCECIAVPDKDSGITLYDFDAKPIINMTEAFGADCFFRVFYCDGEKVIFNVSRDAESEAIDSDYYCVDKKGELRYVLDFGGDYIHSFQGGYFVISDKEGHKRISDLFGNIITPESKAYTDVVYDRVGKSFWCYNEKKMTLEKTDFSGKTLLSKSAKNIKNPSWMLLSSPLESSILIQESDNANNFLWFNVNSGKKIKLDTSGVDSFGDISGEKYDYIAAYYGKSADLYDSSGTFIRTVKDIESYHGIYNGKIAYRDAQGRLCVRGLRSAFEMKIPLDEENAEKVWVSDFSDDIITFSYQCGEGETPRHTVYSLRTQQLLDENIKEYRSFETENGKVYSGLLDGKYVLKDSSGKTLIAISEKSGR